MCHECDDRGCQGRGPDVRYFVAFGIGAAAGLVYTLGRITWAWADPKGKALLETALNGAALTLQQARAAAGGRSTGSLEDYQASPPDVSDLIARISAVRHHDNLPQQA